MSKELNCDNTIFLYYVMKQWEDNRILNFIVHLGPGCHIYLLFPFNILSNTLKLVYETDIYPNYAIIQIASILNFDSSQDVD